MSDRDDDFELLETYVDNNDNEAMTQLYRKYSREMYDHAKGRFPRHQDRVDDATQEAWLRICETAHEFVERAQRNPGASRNVRGWIFRILANTVGEQRRDMKRARRLREIPVDEDGIETIECQRPSVLDQLEPDDRSDLHAAVRDALDRMPEDQRRAVTRVEIGDEKFRDIASSLDANQKTVESRYRYGMRRLDSELAPFRARAKGQE